MTSVEAKNYGSVSSDAHAVSARKGTFTGRKRARLSVKVAATPYMWASGPAFYYLIVIIIGLFGNEFLGVLGDCFYAL